MHLTDLMRSDIAILPKKRGSEYYPSYLERIFKEYIDELKKITPNQPLYPNPLKFNSDDILNNIFVVQDMADGILRAVNRYFDGNILDSYTELKIVLDKHSGIFNSLISNKQTIESMNKNHYFNGLFRAREKEDGKIFQLKDLFHVPFQYRYGIKTKRYSVPGLPCLYLGSSIYVCWEEFDRIDQDRMVVSKYTPSDEFNMTFLDFAYRPKLLGRLMAEKNFFLNIDFVKANILLWPLIASCSIKAEQSNTVFKPEYIVPQFLFQNTSFEYNFDGIRYFSTKIDYDIKNSLLNTNYVFIPKAVSKNGQCSFLKSQFEMTEPIYWQIYSSMQLSSRPALAGNGDIELIKTIQSKYNTTAFGDFESKFVSIPYTSLP